MAFTFSIQISTACLSAYSLLYCHINSQKSRNLLATSERTSVGVVEKYIFKTLSMGNKSQFNNFLWPQAKAGVTISREWKESPPPLFCITGLFMASRLTKRCFVACNNDVIDIFLFFFLQLWLINKSAWNCCFAILHWSPGEAIRSTCVVIDLEGVSSN